MQHTDTKTGFTYKNIIIDPTITNDIKVPVGSVHISE